MILRRRLGMPLAPNRLAPAYDKALHNNNVEIHNTPTGEYNYSQYIPYLAIGGILLFLIYKPY